MADWDALSSTMNESVVGVLGRDVVYQSRNPGAEPQTVKGIAEPAGPETREANSTAMVLFLQLSDMNETPQERDTVTIGADTYRVWQVEVDRAGGVLLGIRRE